MKDNLGLALLFLVIGTLLISGVIIFKNQKTVHYTTSPSSGREASDIGKLINE